MSDGIGGYRYPIGFPMEVDDVAMRSPALTADLKPQNHTDPRDDSITEDELDAEFTRKRRHSTPSTIQVPVSEEGAITAELG